MPFGDYQNFRDFCEKQGLTRQEGIEILKRELKQLGVAV